MIDTVLILRALILLGIGVYFCVASIAAHLELADRNISLVRSLRSVAVATALFFLSTLSLSGAALFRSLDNYKLVTLVLLSINLVSLIWLAIEHKRLTDNLLRQNGH